MDPIRKLCISVLKLNLLAITIFSFILHRYATKLQMCYIDVSLSFVAFRAQNLASRIFYAGSVGLHLSVDFAYRHLHCSRFIA